MKFLIYLLCLLGAGIACTVINGSGILHELSQMLSSDRDAAALAYGAVNGIMTIALYGYAFHAAGRFSKRWDTRKFEKEAQQAGCSPFQYARRITDRKIIAQCEADAATNGPALIERLERYAEQGVLERACAEALIDGYTEILNDR